MNTPQENSKGRNLHTQPSWALGSMGKAELVRRGGESQEVVLSIWSACDLCLVKGLVLDLLDFLPKPSVLFKLIPFTFLEFLIFQGNSRLRAP